MALSGKGYGNRLPMTQREYDYKMAALRSQPIPSGAYASPMVRGGTRMSAKREMMDAYYGKPGFEDVYSSWAPQSFGSKNREYKKRLAVAMQRGINRRGRGRR